MAAQVTNNRSLCGIVEYDDGAGGLLAGGRLTCNHMDTETSEVDHMSIQNNIDLQGTLTVAGTEITPTWLSYLYGLTGNIQHQLNIIIGTHLSANNIWTGLNTFTNAVVFTGATVTGLTKMTVGLTNVDNTADLAKPVSVATQAALDQKLDINSSVLVVQQSQITTNTNNIADLTTEVVTDTANIATNTTNIATNTANIATNTTAIATNTTAIALNTANIATNTTAIATNTTDIAINTANIATILATPNVETIGVDTTTTTASGTNATVTNVGTNEDMLLRFTIPRGADGRNGKDGSDGKDGKDGSDGSNGSNGSNGDSTAATIAAGVAAGSAAAAAGAAAASAASAAASAASAGVATASLLAMETQLLNVEGEIAGVASDLAVVQSDVVAINEEITLLQEKTVFQTAGPATTIFASSLECSNIASTGTISSVWGVESSSFSGGELPTRISGPTINIGTSETLFNTVTIGNYNTVTTINGVVNFTNPFNNFFSQF